MSCLFILQKNEYTCNTQLLLNKPLFLHISPPPSLFCWSNLKAELIRQIIQ